MTFSTEDSVEFVEEGDGRRLIVVTQWLPEEEAFGASMVVAENVHPEFWSFIYEALRFYREWVNNE